MNHCIARTVRAFQKSDGCDDDLLQSTHRGEIHRGEIHSGEIHKVEIHGGEIIQDGRGLSQAPTFPTTDSFSINVHSTLARSASSLGSSALVCGGATSSTSKSSRSEISLRVPQQPIS